METTTNESILKMLECYNSCTTTVKHCLGKGGEHADPEHINVLLDCAKICQTAADFMIRESPNHAAVCGLCADVCRECAESCEALAGDDETMKECAKICRECAEECDKMS